MKKLVCLLLSLLLLGTLFGTTVLADDGWTGFYPISPRVYSIKITTLPQKLEYYEGEELNLAGGSITVDYSSSRSDVFSITEAMVTGFDSSVLGPQTLTVTYKSKTDTFEIVVREKPVLGILLTQPPTGLVYNKYTGLVEVTGGQILVEYEGLDPKPVDLTGEMLSGYQITNQQSQEFLITYKTKTCTFDAVLQGAYTPGDVDNNNSVDLYDVITLARLVAEWDGLTYNAAAADTDGNQEVNLNDVILLARYVAEWQVEVK